MFAQGQPYGASTYAAEKGHKGRPRTTFFHTVPSLWTLPVSVKLRAEVTENGSYVRATGKFSLTCFSSAICEITAETWGLLSTKR